MEKLGNAGVVIGVDANPIERLAVRCADPRGRTPKWAEAAIGLLAERCARSGRCASDMYPAWVAESYDGDSLGCPGWCMLAAMLEDSPAGDGGSDAAIGL